MSSSSSRLFLLGLLAISGWALVASQDLPKTVVSLLQEPDFSSRKQRDLLLSDADEDFDFFQSLNSKSENQMKSVRLNAFDKLRSDRNGHQEAARIRRLLIKLQVRSDQFLDVAQRTGYSAVELLIAFSKLVENSEDRFVIIAQ